MAKTYDWASMVRALDGKEQPSVVYEFGGGKVRFTEDPDTGVIRKEADRNTNTLSK